mmetsp:Transcript_19612/g.35508  ORF Transcript_19612/g.35508 Transcript_19612/m.35508 type:complete len:212 (-) Transcript_19612:179-814(-)|eukprot:CAMPEP_0201901566 /NCGR_PEP_ID=MMETSP0902-20130614/54500_1 /ASSEMBLY_ACC=CAM_ASM_000551 /TAXON_ID=420261 /ORGANISM="Thalassiosira antarctica, Strain CCMP982" /LENGTH=211 /DNA_ID=CAMNT_0048435531 /DNA_START=81 /DNA_END=716 /DNA_ORIENTATION=-
MTHRLESIAIGACRRLSRNPPSLRCGLTAPMQITSSRIRPATAIITNQHRHFHVTTIKQDDAPPVPKIDLENLAPFTSPKVEALFKKMMWLDMIEIHLLAEMINEKLGITISDAEHARMARGGGGGGKKGEAAEEEVVVEKTAFDLKLTGFDAKSKIKVIKEVRAMTSLGLKEAKELVESAPTTVRKDIKKEEAEELMAKLVALGATVEIV